MFSFQNQESGGMSRASDERSPDEFHTANIVETRMLYLSTKSSQCTQLNGTMKSLVSFDLKSYLDFQGDDSIQSVMFSMPYAILCNSNYQCNSTNNRLDVSFNNVNYTYLFPAGNYDANTWQAAFVTLLPSTFSIVLNTVNGVFTVSNSSYPFQFLSTSTCDYIFGFSGTISSTTVGAPYTLAMSRLCNFLPNPLFRVCVLNNSIYCGTVLGANGASQYSNVLASIPNVSKSNTTVIWQSFSDEFLIQTSNQTTLTIAIVDDNNNLIDFNGVSSYFQIRIRLYRKVTRSKAQFNHFLHRATSANYAMENREGLFAEKPISEIL